LIETSERNGQVEVLKVIPSSLVLWSSMLGSSVLGCPVSTPTHIT